MLTNIQPACAYYLHKFAPNESNVFNTHVYDANDYIGGRINEITFGGQVNILFKNNFEYFLLNNSLFLYS